MMWGDSCLSLVDMNDEACCLACWVWSDVVKCLEKVVALALLLHCCVAQAAMEEGCGLLSLVACDNENRRRRQTRRNRRFIFLIRVSMKVEGINRRPL